MNRSTQLHRYAIRIAKQFQKDQPPPLDAKIMAHLDSHPEYLMESLQRLAEQIKAGKSIDDDLTKAYLWLMGIQLEHIRYQVDRHYDWARELVAQFQQTVIDLAHTDKLSGTILQQIALALREAKLEVDPGLFLAIEETIQTPDVPLEQPPDFDELLASFVREIKGSEFEVARTITEFTYAMPVQGRLSLAFTMLHSDFPKVKNAVPLMILDDIKAMRQGITQMLQETAKTLTPETLRRLIALRSWLPANERPQVDKIVKTARRQGIECAQWSATEEAEIHGAAVDGSGAQGFLIVAGKGRKCRLSSVLLRLNSGIMDAWSDPELKPRREIDRHISRAAEHTLIESVSRDYLDRAVQHHLAVGCRNKQLPPPGLLAVAEVLGASDWRPDELNIEKTIDRLFQQLPSQLQRPEAIDDCLEESEVWSLYSGITDSWFEDDQTVAEQLAQSRARRLETLSKKVLTEVIEPRRDKWVEKLLWAALWFKNTSGFDSELWMNFLLTAKALVQGYPLKKISLFQEIARRTVMALR